MSINKSHFALAVSLLSSSCFQAKHHDPFKAMNESFEVMAKEMHGMIENMGKMQHDFFQSMRQEIGTLPVGEDGINVLVSEDEAGAQVKISGVLADRFGADFTDSELTIKAPSDAQGSIVKIALDHGVISVGIKQEIKEEKQEDMQEGQTRTGNYFSSASHISQRLSKKVNLQDAAIDYAKESKTLTVRIPAKNLKKLSKAIPVNVK